jgi:hypothetical protein
VLSLFYFKEDTRIRVLKKQINLREKKTNNKILPSFNEGYIKYGRIKVDKLKEINLYGK